ncbi:MAG TPA: 4Fe-4S binding protein [Geopsychrobacteraceae bacterium]
MRVFDREYRDPLSWNTNQRRKLMAHVINEECINCGACEPACPVDAIHEVGDVRAIDAGACTDCGACVDTCPVDAIDAP